MRHFLRHILPGAIAVSGITVAQLHGAGFWIGLFGSAWMGWVVSLTWESASVWLWWRRDKDIRRRGAKWIATLALVAGMVIQSAGPVLDSMNRAEADRDVLTLLEKQTDKGWWVNSNEILSLGKRLGDGGSTTRMEVTAWVTLFAMPTLYGLALLALVTISREWGRGKPESDGAERSGEVWEDSGAHPNIRRTPELPEPNSGMVSNGVGMERKVSIRRFGAAHKLTNKKGKISQAKVAEKIGVSPSTLSEWGNGKNDNPEILEKLKLDQTEVSIHEK